MSKFVIYSHERYNPESEMFLICTCKSRESANYIVDALKYKDSGNESDNGMYDYYIEYVELD